MGDDDDSRSTDLSSLPMEWSCGPAEHTRVISMRMPWPHWHPHYSSSAVQTQSSPTTLRAKPDFKSNGRQRGGASLLSPCLR